MAEDGAGEEGVLLGEWPLPGGEEQENERLCLPLKLESQLKLEADEDPGAGGGCCSHMGCVHYRRQCKLVAPCCGEQYWCRHCHNESQSHEVDRKEITEMVCMHCNTQQPSAQDCRECGKRLGVYFCKLCNFWDDQGEEKEVFHCEKCGICRVGGRDNYFHCSTCDSCYPVQIRESHRCVENAMHNDCPVCLHGLFHSTSEVSVLHCGHTIHAACLSKLLASGGLSSMRCPICSVSLCIVGMWDEVDRQVAATPMPDEYRIPVELLCNDCQKVSTCEFHILGLKCAECSSYNTRRI